MQGKYNSIMILRCPALSIMSPQSHDVYIVLDGEASQGELNRKLRLRTYNWVRMTKTR